LSGAFQVATNRGGNRQQSVRIGGLPDALARPHKALLPRHQAAAAHGLQGVVDGAGLNSPGIGRRRRVGRVTPAVCAKVLQQGETNPLAFGGHAAGGGVGLQQIAELGALVPVQPPARAVAKDAGAVPGMGCAVDMASRSSVEPRPGEVATRQADPVARRGLQKARRVGRIAFSRVRSSRLCRTFGGHLHGWPLAFRGVLGFSKSLRIGAASDHGIDQRECLPPIKQPCGKIICHDQMVTGECGKRGKTPGRRAFFACPGSTRCDSLRMCRCHSRFPS
jgi:hypothetical protein